MQRPIKFRAWDSKNKKLVTSGLSLNIDTTGCVSPISFSMGDTSYCQINEVEFVPEIYHDVKLMQYTGLKDKNGIEIYEGDMASVFVENTPRIADVSFHDGSFVFGVDKYLLTVDELNRWRETVEVIGNIYENPELLK